MMALILITLFLGIFTVDGLPLSRQINDINSQQQYIGYTTNTLHSNVDYPDQRAESTIKTNYNYNNNNRQSQIIHNYNQEQQQQQQQQPVISYQTTPPQQSQLFNVGYSVKFGNNNNNFDNSRRHIQVQRQRPKYNDGEIITGTRKHNEQVQVPDFNQTPQEFVSNALIENKKAKLSGIKTKHQFVQATNNLPDPKLLINQANLTPTTQKFYKNLEHVRVPQQNQADLQQKYTWRSLSPSVEIIQSTEVPVVQKYANNEAKYFDHSAALGKSQGFDYTNVLNINNNQQQQQQQVATVVSNVATPVMAEIPIDTTLLREPVRIDTRFVQEVLRQNYGTNQPQYIPKYQTIQPQVFYNNHNDKTNSYQDYQQEPSRYQNRINSKPLIQTERRPRYVQYSLQTDLQPPPMLTSRFQRRISGRISNF